ncbi:MAG: hypothetical protein AAFR21_04800 [Pseudomonadota bacterium]
MAQRRLKDSEMLCWLKAQIQVIELWREELAQRPGIDVQSIEFVERHYHWLTAEAYRIDGGRPETIH